MGHWLSSNEGRNTFNECLGIVVRGFGEEGKGTRFAKMWACGLMAAIKIATSWSILSSQTSLSKKGKEKPDTQVKSDRIVKEVSRLI